MKSECLNLNVLDLNQPSLAEKSNPSEFEIYDDLLHKLIPAINSIQMIAEMIDEERLGPVDLGPYKQYIKDLKNCVEVQDTFSKLLASYIASGK